MMYIKRCENRVKQIEIKTELIKTKPIERKTTD